MTRRQLKDWPPHVQQQIRNQTAKGRSKAKKAVEHRQKVKAAIAARIEEGTPQIDRRPLRIFLPGLRLKSENKILGGDSDTRTPAIKIRINAKDEARAALSEYKFLHRAELCRFEACRVDIDVIQHYELGATIDAGNLWHKAVIDGLQNPTEKATWRLGIIPDDCTKFVRRVSSMGLANQKQTGVEIIVTPVDE